MVLKDSFTVSQLADAQFNTFVLVQYRQNKAEVSMTVRVHDAIGNDKTVDTEGNADKMVFYTSSSHGQPWVRHTILPNGVDFKGTVGLTGLDLEAEVLASVPHIIDAFSQPMFYINSITPNYDYTQSQWKN